MDSLMATYHWIGACMLWAAAAIAVVAAYLAIRATAAGARLPSWRLAIASSAARRTRSPLTTDRHAKTARRVVVLALISGFLALAGYGIRQGPQTSTCLCALLPHAGFYAATIDRDQELESP